MSDADELSQVTELLASLYKAGMNPELAAKLAQHPALAEQVVYQIEAYDPEPTWSESLCVELDRDTQEILPGLKVYLSRRNGLVVGYFVGKPGSQSWLPRRTIGLAYTLGWQDLCEGVQIRRTFDDWVLKFAFRVRSDSPHALPM